MDQKQTKTGNIDPIEDQWDGSDIEPSHPRTTVEANRRLLEELYFKLYREGDRFS